MSSPSPSCATSVGTRLPDQIAVPTQKAAREARHAEMSVRFVDSIGPHAHVRQVGIGARATVEPRQHLGDRIADDVRIIILYRDACVPGEMPKRMAIGHRLLERLAERQIGSVRQTLAVRADPNDAVNQLAAHPIQASWNIGLITTCQHHASSELPKECILHLVP
jgi:hypothetical protein